MTVVYYHESDVPFPTITTTSKAYWDQNHRIDDSDGPDYGAILEAMNASGAAELMESIFDPMTTTVDAIIANMRERGFDMRTDPAFSATCENQGDT